MNAPPRNDNATGQGGVGEAAKQTEQQQQHTNPRPYTQTELTEMRALIGTVKAQAVLVTVLAEEAEEIVKAIERGES